MRFPKTYCAAALLLSSPLLPAAPIISEFMADNGSAIYDEDGSSSDWIELHNPDSTAVDLGGYFQPNDAKASAAMRPSATFNDALDALAAC